MAVRILKHKPVRKRRTLREQAMLAAMAWLESRGRRTDDPRIVEYVEAELVLTPPKGVAHANRLGRKAAADYLAVRRLEEA